MRFIFLRPTHRLNPLFGSVLCAGAAAGLCTFFRNSSIKSAVPFLFLAVVLAIAARFGTAAGVLGTISSAVVFALLLFEPLHALAISDPAEKNSVAWMLVGGIVLSGFFGRDR